MNAFLCPSTRCILLTVLLCSSTRQILCPCSSAPRFVKSFVRVPLLLDALNPCRSSAPRFGKSFHPSPPFLDSNPPFLSILGCAPRIPCSFNPLYALLESRAPLILRMRSSNPPLFLPACSTTRLLMESSRRLLCFWTLSSCVRAPQIRPLVLRTGPVYRILRSSLLLVESTPA